MYGNHLDWPTDWEVGRQIKLLRCTFSRSSLEISRNLSIELEVEAPTTDAAMSIGKDIIIKEFDLFTLCAENPLSLDENYISADVV